MTRIRMRRGTSAQWVAANPVLGEGEFGFETDTVKLKIGDGTSEWVGLSYISLDWGTLVGKPVVIAAGATEADARAAIGAEDAAAKGQPSGYASLDVDGLVPQEQLPITTADWDTLEGKPAVIAAGDTQAAARAEIDAASLDANGLVPQEELPETLVTLSASQSLSNKTLTNPTVVGYTEGVNSLGTVGSSVTLSLASGTVITATLTASTASVFTMPIPVAGHSFVLMLSQEASTGAGSATFADVKWGKSGAPTITADAGKMDILSFFSDGTNWYGSIAAGYTP